MSEPTFTGERFVPGQGGLQIAYEHLHRYLYASRWASDKRVLDVAAGSGYGSSILAQSAAKVFALDVDEPTVKHARSTYGAGNIHFVQGDATSLPLKSGTVDMVVAFEVIEHVPDPERMVSEIARVVLPGGIVLISTPDRATYSDARNYTNPYHIHEFYCDEFLSLIGRFFGHVQLLQQQIRAGSLLESYDRDSPCEFEVITVPPPDPQRLTTLPLYLLALCRLEPDSKPACRTSAYLDRTDAYFEEWGQRLAQASTEIERLNSLSHELGLWGQNLNAELMERDASIRQFLEDLRARDEKIRQLLTELDKSRQEIQRLDLEHDELKREIERRGKRMADRDQTLAALRAEFDARGEWAQTLEQDVSSLHAELSSLHGELEQRFQWVQMLEQKLSSLQGEFDERGRWALRLEQELFVSRTELQSLRLEYDARGRWARTLEQDISNRDTRIKELMQILNRTETELLCIRRARLYRVLRRLGMLPR